MGITIHYNLEFTGNKRDVVNILKCLTQDAYDLGFKHISSIWSIKYDTDLDVVDESSVISDSAKDVYQWAKIQCQPEPPQIKLQTDSLSKLKKKESLTNSYNKRLKRMNGLVLNTQYDEFCEPTNIGLVRIGNGKKWVCNGLYTKTIYAKDFVNAHINVCALLSCAAKLGIICNVFDETGYWQDNDITKLIDSSERSLKTINDLKSLLDHAIELSGEKDINIKGHGTRAGKMLENIPDLDW